MTTTTIKKKKKCVKGFECGYTCIKQGLKCAEKKQAEAKRYLENLTENIEEVTPEVTPEVTKGKSKTPRKGEIEIPVSNRVPGKPKKVIREKVPADILGDWAVHETLGDFNLSGASTPNYTITHVPSGLSLYTKGKKGQLITVIKVLNDLGIDWSEKEANKLLSGDNRKILSLINKGLDPRASKDIQEALFEARNLRTY